MKGAFDTMDVNRDGGIAKGELIKLLKSCGEFCTDAVVDEMMKIADENGDGEIQFAEFVKAAQSDLFVTKTEDYEEEFATIDVPEQ